MDGERGGKGDKQRQARRGTLESNLFLDLGTYLWSPVSNVQCLSELLVAVHVTSLGKSASNRAGRGRSVSGEEVWEPVDGSTC